MFGSSPTNLSGPATGPRERPPFLSGSETLPEDFFILLSRQDGGSGHSHHPQGRPLVCPERLPGCCGPSEPPDSPSPSTFNSSHSKLWQVKFSCSLPLLKLSLLLVVPSSSNTLKVSLLGSTSEFSPPGEKRYPPTHPSQPPGPSPRGAPFY